MYVMAARKTELLLIAPQNQKIHLAQSGSQQTEEDEEPSPVPVPRAKPSPRTATQIGKVRAKLMALQNQKEWVCTPFKRQIVSYVVFFFAVSS